MDPVRHGKSSSENSKVLPLIQMPLMVMVAVHTCQILTFLVIVLCENSASESHVTMWHLGDSI